MRGSSGPCRRTARRGATLLRPPAAPPAYVVVPPWRAAPPRRGTSGTGSSPYCPHSCKRHTALRSRGQRAGWRAVLSWKAARRKGAHLTEEQNMQKTSRQSSHCRVQVSQTPRLQYEQLLRWRAWRHAQHVPVCCIASAASAAACCCCCCARNISCVVRSVFARDTVQPTR